MANNPIVFNDVLGDTIRGINSSSGMRLKNEIHESFSGNEATDLRKLFKLESDGKTMASIDQEKIMSAIGNLTDDQQDLAYSYLRTINSSNT